MISINDGFFTVKVGQIRIAFVNSPSEVSKATSSGAYLCTLSEKGFSGGIEGSQLVASTPGEYGLDGLAAKIVGCGGYNFNMINYANGTRLSELSSGLLVDPGQKDALAILMNENANGGDGSSLIIINCLYDLEFDQDEFVRGLTSAVKNADKQKWILLSSSTHSGYLQESLLKSGLDVSQLSSDDFKLKKSSDVAGISDVNILF